MHDLPLFFLFVAASCGLAAEDGPRLRIFTVATEQTDGFRRFARSAAAYGHEVVVLGLGEAWLGGDTRYETGGGQKVRLLRDALEPLKYDGSLLVLFADSYDVIVDADAAAVVRTLADSFEGARVVFSAEGFCWPDAELASRYPLVTAGKRYLNSGLFVGYAPDLYALLTHASLADSDDDQLYYTNIFLDEHMRDHLKIKLDSTSKLFQNLHGAEEDVDVLLGDDGSVTLKNFAYNTKPLLVHGNGPSKLGRFNYLGNYIAKSWNAVDGCLACREDLLSLDAVPPSDLPLVALAVFIAKPTPFVEEFLQFLSALNYPKDRLLLFVYNAAPTHAAEVDAFVAAERGRYADSRLIGATAELTETRARNDAVDFCVEKRCEYLFAVDAEAHLTNRDVLRALIRQNRPIVAPLLARPGQLWSNFWGAVSSSGFYARSNDYVAIAKSERRGVWNVPYINSAYLINGTKLAQAKNAYSCDGDADMCFCQFMREQGHFMFASNMEHFGHLIDTDEFESTHTHNELYEVFNNKAVRALSWGSGDARVQEWEGRYLHENYSLTLAAELDAVPQPCPDVFDFPLFSRRFCSELIGEMEAYGEWSSGANDDERLTGGYENVPTRDIHMKQIGMERHFLHLLDKYVRPMQEKVFAGYYHEPAEAYMNFVVRYRADEQPSLRPHQDASTFSITTALNRRGVDFEGGGTRFLRYNCTVADHQLGWTIIFPGRLTHLHEGLPTTAGTRYILVSFVNP